MSDKFTLKWVKENYPPEELIKLTKRDKIERKKVSIDTFDTVQELLDYFDVDPINIKFEIGGVYSSFDYFAYVDYRVEKTEEERFKEGAKIKQEKLNADLNKKKKQEKEREEYERLKKKFENK